MAYELVFTQTAADHVRMLTAVENGGAGDVSRRLKLAAHHGAALGVGKIGEMIPDLVQLRREAQKCDATWSSGRRFVGRC
jgi:hypothetical protein